MTRTVQLGENITAQSVLSYIDDGNLPSAAQVRQSRIIEAMSEGNFEPFYKRLKEKDPYVVKKLARAAASFQDSMDEEDDLRRQALLLESVADIREATGPDNFPYLIGANMRTRLAQGYTNQETYWQAWCATDTVDDFEVHKFAWLGGFGAPDTIPPGAEYPEVRQSEYMGSYSVQKYGVITAMQWEQQQADKLNAFGKQLSQIGAGFATIPDSLTTAIYTNNAATTYDGITMLHATSHGANKVTDALSETAVEAGISQGLTLTDWAGNKAPVRYDRLMVYPTLHGTADRICNSSLMIVTGLSSTSTAATIGGRNPVFKNNLKWFVNPYLTTATDWALLAPPETVPCVTLVELSGYTGIMFFSETRDAGSYFERDVMRWKVMRINGAYCQDHRLYGRVG